MFFARPILLKPIAVPGAKYYNSEGFGLYSI
jgi:hypothetical protein